MENKSLTADIANKLQPAKSLEEVRARADALFLSIGSGAIATDENGKIYRVNKVALDMLGYTEKDILGKWFPKVIKAVDENGEEIPLINRPITQSLVTGGPVSSKTYYKTSSGNQLPVSITVSPIILNGKPVGTVEVFYDRSHENEVDRMKSEFISIASHQLRTPLSAINTYANLLSSGYEGELNKGQQAQMDIILSAVDKMNDLITTLLDISKLEAGALKVRLQETDITRLLGRTIKELKQFAKAKDIDLKVKCPDRSIVMRCDPLLLGEVYTNLISNAIKYTPDQGRVEISLNVKENELIFQVDDTGYGIPEAVQDQVFTKFFRGSNIQKRDTTGTGLGLYMVKQVAEVMGGSLWFKSQENKGSCFRFAMPLNNLADTD
jgi:PAS domain S-box-containing protein